MLIDPSASAINPEMTLNITLLTERTIFQSADFRLTAADIGKIITDTSTKLVTLQYGEWDGFVSYTGIGRWQGRDTSEYIVDWLTGLDHATPEDVAARIRDKGTEWLRTIETAWRRERHTFILATFKEGRPQLAIISNFENCFGRKAANAGPSLAISNIRLAKRPQIVVTGWTPAVTRTARRRIKQLIHERPDDPARIRRMLAEINAEAAQSAGAQAMISPECSVVSFRADGQGACDIDGPVVIHTVVMGNPSPDLRQLIKRLGFDQARLAGMSLSSSKRRIPYALCEPQIIIPADASRYALREVNQKDFVSCRALDVSDASVTLGDGNPPGRPGDYLLWTSTLAGELQPCGFMGKPGGINDRRQVAAEAKMTDGSVHAVLWKGEKLIDLGCYGGRDSGATGINTAGLVVGWVCIDPVERGQAKFRPAAWFLDQGTVLENFGCDWGQAVDVNDEGVVLVVGYLGIQCRAILWNPVAQTFRIVGGGTGIYPTAVTTDGVVLGTASDRDGKSIAYLAKSGQRWEQLGTAAGFHATGMNDHLEIVGAVLRNGYEQPWLRRTSGEIVWLPYFNHHWCRPYAINSSGVIVGAAQTDHGTHALIWTR